MRTSSKQVSSVTSFQAYLPASAFRLLVGAALLLPLTTIAPAATVVWNGPAGEWTTSTNWNSGAGPVPTSADTALFNSGTGSTAVTVASASSVNSITFDTASAAAYTTSGSTLTLSSGGTVQTTSLVANNETINNNVSLGGSYTFSSNAAATTLNFGGNVTSAATAGTTTLTLSGTNTGANKISGIISNGTGTNVVAVTKSGAGNWTLAGANTYTGATTVTGGGTLTLDSTTGSMATTSLSLAGSSFVYSNANATGSPKTQSLGTVSIAAPAAGANGVSTIQNIESGTGTSTLTLGAINRVDGTTLNLVTTGAGASFADSAAFNFNAGVFINGANYATNGGVAGGALRPIDYDTDTTIAFHATVPATAISTSGNIVNVLLNGGSYTGTFVTNSTIKFGVTGATITGNNFVKGFLIGGGGMTGTVATSGANSYRSAGDVVFNAVTATDTLNVTGNFSPFNTVTGGGTSITKVGAGLAIFSGANTYTGNVVINEGTLRSSSNTALGFGGVMAVNNTVGTTNVATGTTLDLATSGTVTVNEPIVLTGSSLINSGTGTTVIDNGVAGIRFVTAGAGTGYTSVPSVSIAGTGTGATAVVNSVNGGAIEAVKTTAAGSGFTTTPTVTITGVGTGGAATAILSSLTLNGANTIGGSGNLTVNAVVANGTTAGSFQKTGAGTLIFTGANTYTGGTTLSGGKFLANNTSGSATGTGAVVVASGGTLGGGNTSTGPAVFGGASLSVYSSGAVGVIGGPLTVALGGHLAPGNSVGTLTTGATTLSAGSILDYEFNLTANDFTAATTLTLNGGGFNLFQEGTATPFATAGTYNLLGYTGSIAGSLSNLSVLNPQSGFTYNFLNDTTDSLIQLQIAAVPEPSSMAMLIGGLIGFVAWRGKRRQTRW